MLEALALIVRIILPASLRSIGAEEEARLLNLLPDEITIDEVQDLLKEFEEKTPDLYALRETRNMIAHLEFGRREAFFASAWRAVRATPGRPKHVDIKLFELEYKH